MAYVIADRVKETTTDTGTATLTLAGAASKFIAFSAKCANGDVFPYLIEHTTAAEWETGLGSWGTGGILTRAKVLSSSNANALVNFSAGTKEVSIAAHSVSVANNSSVGGIAAAGTTQGTATGLTATNNFITTATAGSADGVILPAAIRMDDVNVINHSTAPIKIYPATGETVEGGAANAPLTLFPGQAWFGCCFTDGAWDGAHINPWDDENNRLMLPIHASSPASPPTGAQNLIVFNDAMPGPAIQHESLLWPMPLQRSMYRLYAKKHQAVGGGSTIPSAYGGSAALTIMTTATARTPASGSLANASHRTASVSAATAGSVCGVYYAAGDAVLVSPNATLFCSIRFKISDAATVSGARGFYGVQQGSTAPTNVEPSTLTNCFGFAQLSTDAANWYFCYGGTSAQTAVNVGATIGAPANTTDLYEASFFLWNNGATIVVYYKLTNLSTNVSVSGSVSGNASSVLPTASATLGLRAWRSNNATALAVAVDVCSFTAEQLA